MPTTTTTTTTTSTEISIPALLIEVNPAPHYRLELFTAVICTPNCKHRINPDGAKLATVMKNVQRFLDEIRELENNPAARMVGSLTA